MRLQGDRERAIAAYEAAHRLDPATPHGRLELADLRRGHPDAVPAGLHLAPMPPSVASDAGEDAAHAAALRAARLSDAFLPLFDPFFYHQANPVVRTAVRQPDRIACLQHFGAAGVDLVLPFAAGLEFDPEFYRESYLHHLAFTPANAYRHWLNTGLGQGAAPNRKAWVRTQLGGRVDSLDGIDLAVLAAQRDPAGAANWVAQAENFLASAGDAAANVAITEETAGIYVALAGRLEGEGAQQADRVFRLRQLIAEWAPTHTANQVKLADSLFHRGSFSEAVKLYRALGPGAMSPGSILGSALCEERLGRRDLAVSTLSRACAVFAGEVGLRRERLAMSQRLFGQGWEHGMALARLGRIAEGQAEVGRVCDAIIAAMRSSEDAAPVRTVRRVALAGHASLPQCAFYRVDQTAELLRLAGFEVSVFDLAADTAAFHAALHGLDAVIFCRVPALPKVVAAIEAARACGLVTFYDMDDLIFDPAYPDPLESYGGLVSRDEHAGLALAVPLFERAMRLCTYGIASTESLAKAMRTRVASGQVFVRPNALGERHLAFAAGAQARRGDNGEAVTLFYGSGGKAHKADFSALVEPALVALVAKYGSRVHVVLVGEFPETAALRSIAANVTMLPAIWNLETYWSVLAQVDINLAVLLPGAATDAKSEIKWLEAAMLGIPSAVSDTATYRAVVTPDTTGVICATAAAWTAALDRLVGDAALRRRLGAQARAEALEHYAPGAMSAVLKEAMQVGGARDARPLVVLAHVFYPPQAVGGATRVVSDNVRDVLALVGDRLEIEVFSCLDGGEPYQVSSDAHDGVRVTRVGSPDVEKLEYRAADERMGKIFGEYLDRTRPALVHFHCIQRLTASIVAATRERRIPYLITVHDGWWISEHQFLLDADGRPQTYDMARPLATLQQHGAAAYERLMALRPALFGARQVLAVSSPFAALYRGCGVPNVVAVENGVPDLAVDLVSHVRVPREDGKVRLGFIGGLARHKGYDLVQIAIAAKPWRNLVLMLIDHGLPQGSVRHEVWGTVAVEFRPKWPQADVAALYAQIDVLLAPSLWPESYGLVTREAILAGCHVIASDRGSIGDRVEEGRSGFIVDVGSPDGLIAALAGIEAEPQRFLQPPPAPPMRTAQAQAQEIVAIYDTILREPPPLE
jgi:glycosyltransferase involved in cell wall biosynthesis